MLDKTEEVKKEHNWDELRAQIFKKYDKDFLVGQLESFAYEKIVDEGLNDKGKMVSQLLNNWFREVQYKAKNIRAKYTPYEVLMSDELLEQAFAKIDKKPDYYNMGSDAMNFVSFVTNEGSMVSKVATFSPNLARKIYESYCPKLNGVIYDYSCGWGARLLGALAPRFNYTYYGTDPNSELNVQLNDFAEFITDTLDDDKYLPDGTLNPRYKKRYDIRCQGSEFFVPEWEGKVDVAFSSPPYFNVEKYCEETTQSSTKNDTYEDWVNLFVVPTTQNIWRYVKPGGYCLINLKNLTDAFGGHLAFCDWVISAVNQGFKLVDMRMMFYQSSRQFGTSKKTGQKRKVNFWGDKEPVGVLYKPKEGEKVTNMGLLYKMQYECAVLNEKGMEDFNGNLESYKKLRRI